ncbi:glycosyltransferase involved in cell wall biosynthesis [Antricoccus suffuscus]|uniref:Glycosyltransferase involved in cell wall biosynthesis n=1 Tax=Antricoccus suffuscus TaxID=1629062 RepID=A0A2T0ZQJ2_9ACTN|nr:glycosyltransferase family 1 protein [Antricoccus suffuscus]PRZ38611.1 glycosyltransferase involved in cell wall biosynthesis [Antricoccus suffuscus]
MRIALDCTPLLGQRTGIGHYTANLLTELLSLAADDSLLATAFTFRGRDQLAGAVPPGVEVAARPAPARALRTMWSHGTMPPVEWLTGGIDVFHATNFVLPPTRRARGVLTVHDLAYLKFPQTVSSASLTYRELVPSGLRRARVVCTPSRAVATQLQDAYALAEEAIAVTPLGVDAAWHRAAAPSGEWRTAHRLGRDYILAVGTIEPRKNLALLVSAYRQLLATHSDVPPLVLAGGAGWGDALDLDGIPADRLVMPGHLPIDDLRTLVAGASLLVFPSLDEGFGLPPLEALACGVPVVASDLPVTREVLGDQARFVAVDERARQTNVDALADAIVSELDAPTGDAATRREYAAGFTWRACAEKTYAAYQRAAEA